MKTIQSSPPLRRRPLRRLLLTVLASLALVPVTVLAGAAPASANTSDFRGMNWAQLGDNFSTSRLVIDGLSSSDSYNTVRAKANAIYDDMEAHMGVNTVRLPINTHTVGTSWWNAYRGAIDAAADRGFKVILTYWEDGAASGGRITNTGAFNSMWDTVVSQYGSNGQVYFEVFNEPHGYSSSEWRDFAAGWLNARPSVPDGRVLIAGVGLNQDLRPVCDDSRFNGTLLSFHHYAFFYGSNSYSGWYNHVQTRLGNCADRAVATEFGAPMDTGLNYNDPNSGDNFVRHIRAVTDVMHDNDMGGTYWPALGGKVTSGQDYDWYSMFGLHGSGTDLSLSLRNQSGADRLLHAWGGDPEPPDEDTVRYEAEDPPAVCDGTIDTDHSGYSGSGFCNTPNEAGSYSQFTVTADSAGEAEVRIRFANGSSGGARGADVVVNGTTVSSTSFETTGGWSSWRTKTLTVPLTEGDNTIRLVATDSGGLPNVDYLDYVVPDDGSEPVRYEAEDPPAVCDGTIDTNHAGYSGTGFCNTPNESGSYSQFTVNAASAGEATVEIGFANGSSGGARGADVVVNGSTVEAISFEVTGGWNVWSTKTVTVPLNEGDNTIRLVATGSGGLPNIDYLDA